jgi:mannosyltransferase OCH1-like enzyme
MKKVYNPIVPLTIYQTWHSKKRLPVRMNNNIVLLKKNNPRFEYFLFDDEDCEKFIRNHYDADVLNAYQTLIPGAYKADLWRYCILYKKGGIYLDIKYGYVNGFKLINLTEKEHFCLDEDNNGIYNAIMVCKPGNKILAKAIRQIVENVKTRFYGNGSLDPTGPRLLSHYFSREEKDRMELKHIFIGNFYNRFVTFKNYFILKQYDGYLEDHDHYKKTDHYVKLWEERRIYH